MAEPALKPVAGLASLRAYRPPRHPAPVDLDLAGNEGAGPVEGLGEDIETEDLRRYPREGAAAFEAQVAERLGIAPERVVVTAGGDEAIDRVCRAYLEPGRRFVLPTPTFDMLPHYGGLTGAEVAPVPWPEGPYPVEAVLDAAAGAPAVIVVVTPNNPTGAVATAGDLERLSAEAPGALLLVDLAYVEFADEDLTAAALALPNAVVVRTLSKAWGLAGIRVGYAAGPPEVTASLRDAGGPFPVAGPSLVMAARALTEGEAHAEAYVARVREEREQLAELAGDLGLRARRSQGNFVLLDCPEPGPDPTWLRDGLAGLGIALRLFPGREGLERSVRITCPGAAEAFGRLEHALRCVLTPEGLLYEGDAQTAPPPDRGLPVERVDKGGGGLTVALERLGRRVWLLARSPEAVRFGRNLGLLPVAVAEDEETREALLASGAARALASTGELEELLP